MSPTPASDAASGQQSSRTLTIGMRRMLYAAALLVFGVGVPLFVLSEYTDTLFAWTIAPPLTAAFIGACYWSACALELLAARERHWAHARVAVPGVWLFTALTCVPTIINFKHFNLASPAAYAWIAVYFSVPAVLGWLWYRQVKAPGHDPARTRPLPIYLRAWYILLGVGLLALGVVQAFAPELAPWPWDLNPPGNAYSNVARMEPYLAVWMVGFATVALHAAIENDLARIRCVLASGLVLPPLQAAALARYPDTFQWNTPAAWIFIGVFLVLFIVSALGWRRLRAR